MKIFQPMYLKAMQWAQHKNAAALLGVLSFLEAFIFPVPPEMMLAPMCLAKPKSGFWYAGISLGASMIGMFIGYAIGHFAIDMAMPLIAKMGYANQFEEIKKQAIDNGFWLLVIAGFTPVPFKIFTLAAGAVGMPLLPFFFGAFIGRGKRVFLVAAAIRFGGEKAEAALRKYIEPIGWFALIVLVGFVIWIFMKPQGA
jgi:membrane protein YqaA with SNARE-associated domain